MSPMCLLLYLDTSHARPVSFPHADLLRLGGRKGGYSWDSCGRSRAAAAAARTEEQPPPPQEPEPPLLHWQGPPEVGAAPGEGGRSPARGTAAGERDPGGAARSRAQRRPRTEPGTRLEAAGAGGLSASCGEGGCWRSPWDLPCS